MEIRTLNLPRPGAAASQDRVFVQLRGAVAWFALADGAGGQSGGVEAADRVCREAEAAVSPVRPEPFVLQERLMALDAALAADGRAGLCTAIIGVREGASLVGCSVGDSELWIVEPDRHEVVTRRQYRRPLLGSGEAMPVVFEARVPPGAVVLVASDGLFASAPRDAILDACRRADLGVVLTRLRALRAQDDLGIILLR